jgi:hypothetical protein
VLVTGNNVINPDMDLFSECLRGKVIIMSEQIPLQRELEYFQKHKQEYLKLYKNQFVLIKGEKFAGAFTTEAEAYQAGLEKFGNEPFLIRNWTDLYASEPNSW